MGKRTPIGPLHPVDRVYWKHGAFHYVDKQNKWHNLGKEWDKAAKEKWAALSSPTLHEGTVALLLESYLVHLRSLKDAGHISPRHYEDRKADKEPLVRFFGGMRVVDVTRADVAYYLKNRKSKRDGSPAPIRANREIAMLSAAYNWDTTLNHNPCLNVPKNKEYARTRYVQHWERRQFAKRCCPDWLRAYLLLKYLTGLRMGDMLRLVDSPESRGLRIPTGKSGGSKVLEFRKTWAIRTVGQFIHRVHASTKLHSNVEEHERKRTGDQNQSRWFPITSAGFKSAWRRAMKKWVAMGNEPFREHDIRAKTGSDSKNVTEAQHRLAHSTTKTTQRHYRRGVIKVEPLR